MVRSKHTILEHSAGLDDLHRESLGWVSEIKLWHEELSFFLKLIDNYKGNFKSPEDSDKLTHYQKLVNYYNDELLNKFNKKIIGHEKFLAKEVMSSQNIDDVTYREKHINVSSHIHSYRIEFNMFKREFFEFISEAL